MTPGELGSVAASAGDKYTEARQGEELSVNGKYMLGFLTSSVRVNDDEAETGDFVFFKSDYSKQSKHLQFTKPVVIGDSLYIDGNTEFNNELQLWFNGYSWQDNQYSNAPLLDIGVYEASESKTVTLADLVNSTFTKPLHLTIEVAGGCGGACMRVTYDSEGIPDIHSINGGGGGGYGAIEMVIFPDVGFPVIEFVAGAGGGSYTNKYGEDGGTSTLTVNGVKTFDCFGGKGNKVYSYNSIAQGSNATYSSGLPVLYHETVMGGDSVPYGHSMHVVTCKYRSVGGGTGSGNAKGFGWAAIGTRGGFGAENAGRNGQAGKIMITYRPATPQEIAQQEGLNKL